MNFVVHEPSTGEKKKWLENLQLLITKLKVEREKEYTLKLKAVK